MGEQKISLPLWADIAIGLIALSTLLTAILAVLKYVMHIMHHCIP